MSSKPTPDPSIVGALLKFTRENPHDEFILELFYRATLLLEESDLPRAPIAFEMMQSALSAFEGELTHGDIADAYPVNLWREDTVEIPKAWLRVIVEGWEKYKAAPTGMTFGEAFAIEGGGQGKKPVREKLRKLNRDIRILNHAVVEYLMERADGGTGSWDRVSERVADAEGVSVDTVKRILSKRRNTRLEQLAAMGILKNRGNTS